MRRVAGVGVCLACLYGCASWEPGARTAPSAPPTQTGQATNAASTAKAPPPRPFVRHPGKSGNAYSDRFLDLWNDIHDPKSGYFSALGIPYHAIETLMCEAPDHGHETTSEAYSYWIWLEAAYGRITKDWTQLGDAWANMEAYAIPSRDDQPSTGSYQASKPATFAAEWDHPSKYPSPIDPNVAVGKDPIGEELAKTYGTRDIYGMHWLVDVDNWYGFGRRGDGTSSPAFINTFQRGPEESVWETVPQPCWDDFRFGGKHGYLDLFIKDPSPARQWKYTDAPDADARAVQAVYWAKVWSEEQGQGAATSAVVKNASRMGDYLRYSLFDKYFKSLGCKSPSCPPSSDRGSAHYLLSWYYAWGGSLSAAGGWSWRIGSSHAHGGYQNPLAAYALSAGMKPASPSAASDWAASLRRQIELYRWLQSAEGAIAGGATNSVNGRYGSPAPATPTFYGMPYDESPVFMDPPSNEWFGFQAWSMDRVAQYYYATGDKSARVILDKWVAWVKKSTRLDADGGFEIPSGLGWSGKPSLNWDAKTQGFDPTSSAFNAGLHVSIKNTSRDIGVAAALARTLMFYAAKSGDGGAKDLAKQLIDRTWTLYRDSKGVTVPEKREDFKRFGEPLVLPPGWKGTMPNGDPIDSSSTFISIRSKYKSDPAWPKVAAYLKGGAAPEMVYHRFWTQVDVALANATYGWLFPKDAPGNAKH
jgi:hypothetical protein